MRNGITSLMASPGQLWPAAQPACYCSAARPIPKRPPAILSVTYLTFVATVVLLCCSRASQLETEVRKMREALSAAEQRAAAASAKADVLQRAVAQVCSPASPSCDLLSSQGVGSSYEMDPQKACQGMVCVS